VSARVRLTHRRCRAETSGGRAQVCAPCRSPSVNQPHTSPKVYLRAQLPINTSDGTPLTSSRASPASCSTSSAPTRCCAYRRACSCIGTAPYPYSTAAERWAGKADVMASLEQAVMLWPGAMVAALVSLRTKRRATRWQSLLSKRLTVRTRSSCVHLPHKLSRFACSRRRSRAAKRILYLACSAFS
jgi:hypothetical protein